jgi:hypothetical protein
MNESLIIILGIIIGVGLFLVFKYDKYNKSIITYCP